MKKTNKKIDFQVFKPTTSRYSRLIVLFFFLKKKVYKIVMNAVMYLFEHVVKLFKK